VVVQSKVLVVLEGWELELVLKLEELVAKVEEELESAGVGLGLHFGHSQLQFSASLPELLLFPLLAASPLLPPQSLHVSFPALPSGVQGPSQPLAERFGGVPSTHRS